MVTTYETQAKACGAAACTSNCSIRSSTIYDAAIAVGAGTNAAVGGDTVSYTGTTVNVGDENEAGNDPQAAAANSVLAVVFTVTVQ